MRSWQALLQTVAASWCIQPYFFLESLEGCWSCDFCTQALEPRFGALKKIKQPKHCMCMMYTLSGMLQYVYIYISYIYYINSSDFYVFSLCLLDLRNVAFQAWSWCEFLRWVWTKWFLAGKLFGFGRHESFKDSGDNAQRPHPT